MIRAIDTRQCAVGLALLALSSCFSAAIAPVSAQAQGVKVADQAPPPGATLIGPVEATHGHGCALGGTGRGTIEGATALLKEAAAQRGADFVEVLSEKQPYSGRDCFHQEYILKGLAYRVTPVPVVVASATPPAPLPLPAAPLAPASAAAPPRPAECTPPCSPGYECKAGVCEALCNPACSPTQRCRADHVCVSAAPAP